MLHFHVFNTKLHTEERMKSHKGTACISLREIPTHSVVLPLPHMENPLRPGRPLCSHISLPLPVLYYYYFFLLAEAALSPLQEDTVPTHLLEEVSSHGPHSAPSSSRVCPASTDTCLLWLIKYYTVIFLWVCPFSSCPVPGFPVQQGPVGRGQDWGGETR